ATTSTMPPSTHGHTGIPPEPEPEPGGADAPAAGVALPGPPGAAPAGTPCPGPGLVSVKLTDPLTGCPSSETIRYPTVYTPTGPSGATGADTELPSTFDGPASKWLPFGPTTVTVLNDS